MKQMSDHHDSDADAHHHDEGGLEDPARLIGAAAERFGADVICVGSRGRSGLARALLGSVSQGLLLRSRRPVLVIQSPV